MNLRSLICTVLICAAVAHPATAAQSDCANDEYARKNPYECSFINRNSAALLGLATLAGAAGTLALMSGANASSNGNAAPRPTLPTYNMVGGDIDSLALAGIMDRPEYYKNFNQYNEIRLAYSIGRGFTGRGTTIAVLDGGDDTAHGRNVVRMISGAIAPDANIESYKILTPDFKFVPFSQIGTIIDAASNANIINASWNADIAASALHTRKQLIEITDINFVNSISDAAARDTIFVWAAGNGGMSESGLLSGLPNVMPELDGKFVNVVAWDNETGALADFSNACGVTAQYCITAPGTNLNNGFMEIHGTSFAAPIVSAALAVIRQAFPYMTAPQITQLLFETARDLGQPGVDEIYGHGMLDLERATRPVGVALVPIDDKITQPLRRAHVTGAVAHRIKSAGLNLAFMDSFGRTFQTPVADNITVRNPGRGLIALRGGDNIMSVTAGTMEFGLRRAEFIPGDGFMKTDGHSHLFSMGQHFDTQIGNTRFTARMNLGITRPRASTDSLVTDFSNVYSADLRISAHRGDWTLSVGIPDAIISGKMHMRLPAGRAASGEMMYYDYALDLATRPSVEYSANYRFITAAFIDNPYGTDEFYVIARGRLAF